MLCVAALSADVLQIAVRVLPAPVSATALQAPIVVPPSVKLTVPVGALPVTDAVKVTLATTIAGFAELETVVPEEAGLTTWDSGALLDAALPAFPAYAATMLCVLALNVLVAQVAVSALPLPISATAPHPAMVAPPSVNATVPVGAVPVTVAVKLTLTPALVGLAELVRPVVEVALFTTCESGALAEGALPASPA